MKRLLPVVMLLLPLLSAQYTPPSSGGGGGGTVVNVNGSTVTTPNFNATTPAATAGYQNVAFQVTGSSVSGQILPSQQGAMDALGAAGASQTIVHTNGAVQTLTLSAALTIAFTQPSTGTARVNLGITQATGTHYAVTWTSVKWPGGIAPVITATDAAIDWVSCLLDGTNTYCTVGQDFK